MKTNLLLILENYSRHLSIVAVRRVKFLFSKSKENTDFEDFFVSSSDSSFSNSLVKIQFHFNNLVWVDFPGIGKKYHNGEILLNADKLPSNFAVTVKTISGKQEFTVEKSEAQLSFASDKFAIQEFNSFKNYLLKKPSPERISFRINNKPSFKKQDKLTVINKISNIKFKNFDKTILYEK